METVILGDLEWQKEDDYVRRSWHEAVEYTKSLRDGWRLPTIEELVTLIDFFGYDPACKLPFCRSSGYWSSSTYAGSPGYAWAVYFNDGYVAYHNKTDVYYVRCVRERR